MNRRNFLKNGLALFAAPAIVKAENIMNIFVPKNHGELIVNSDFEITGFGLVQPKVEGGIYAWDFDHGGWRSLGSRNELWDISMSNDLMVAHVTKSEALGYSSERVHRMVSVI